jgi:CHAT domain-containing protein
MYAGTPRVLVSYWDVSDRPTAYLMDRFYGALDSGQAPASALRTAQLATRRLYPNPFDWAAFVLVGEPR